MSQSDGVRLPENWSRHKAPTGHYYYYNSVTQESTYAKPEVKKQTRQQPHKDNKKPRIEESASPTFKVDLPETQWSLVFTNKGSHFFYNKETNESHWRVEDKAVLEKLQDIEDDSLLLLIAKSRGLRLSEEDDEKLNQSLIPKNETKEIEPCGDESENEVQELLHGIGHNEDQPSEDEQTKQTLSNPLISGYSSSEEDDSDDEKKAEEEREEVPTQSLVENPLEDETELDAPKEQTEPVESEVTQNPIDEGAESSEEENAIDLDMLNDLSSDEGGINDPQQAEAVFFELLQESELDPFGTWESESLKIIDDSRFYEIDDNRDRKRIFDSWATVAITLKQQESNAPKEESNKAEAEEQEEPFVQFIRFIETRDELDRLYVDFKKKWKKHLKKFDLGDREKEKTYKEYMVYHKKPMEEKIKIFTDFLLKSKIFKNNAKNLENKESYASTVKEIEAFEEQKDQDLNVGYRLLHRVENVLQISDSIKYDTKYYIVPIGSRLTRIVKVFDLIR